MTGGGLRIENSDRGITITKGLAWTILTSFLIGGFYVGVELATVRQKIDTLRDERTSFRAEVREEIGTLAEENRELNSRMRVVERAEGQFAERFAAQSRLLERIDSRLQSIDARLRAQETRGRP